MRERFRIQPSMIETYKDDILFMVDTDCTYIEAIEPRMLYVEPLGYEITVDEIEDNVKEILNIFLHILQSSSK